MGCDIHTVIEKKIKTSLDNNIWHICNNFCVPEDSSYEGEKEPKLVMRTTEVGFRNYEMFGILAGVRSDLDPIDLPRGLPEDCHFYTKKFYEENACDFHTPTWYNLKELIDFINKMTTDDIDEDEFDSKESYLNEVKYWQGVIDSLKAYIEEIVNFIYNNQIEFYASRTGYDKVQYFYNECNPELYRIIIWFDN